MLARPVAAAFAVVVALCFPNAGVAAQSSSGDGDAELITVILGCLDTDDSEINPTACFPAKNVALSPDSKSASAGFGDVGGSSSSPSDIPDLSFGSEDRFTLLGGDGGGSSDSDGNFNLNLVEAQIEAQEAECLEAMQGMYGGVCMNNGVCKFKRPNCDGDAPYSLPVCDCGRVSGTICFWGRFCVRTCCATSFRFPLLLLLLFFSKTKKRYAHSRILPVSFLSHADV